MTFNPANLSVADVDAQSDVSTRVFNYTTTANRATVSGNAYWASAGLYLGVRDLIQVVASDGNVLLRVNQLASGAAPVIKVLADQVGTFVL